MNQYITGSIIKKLREDKHMTQLEFAEIIGVSDKAVSKWETGRGLPDVTLIEPIAKAMGISVLELLEGNSITNNNRSFNILRSKIYVCPVCGNVIISTGETVISCCGISLPALESDKSDVNHIINVEMVEDEYYVTLIHEMTKEHYISFIAAISDVGIELIKLYPEGEAEARVKRSRVRKLYAYCNRDGLFTVNLN